MDRRKVLEIFGALSLCTAVGFPHDKEYFEKFSWALVIPLQAEIRNILSNKSPLRRKFEVVKLDPEKLPIIKTGAQHIAYTLSDDGENVWEHKGQKIFTPLFEIAFNPEIPLIK